MKQKSLKTIFYIETPTTSPFQVKWKKLNKILPFIPYPGLLVQDEEKVFSVINCVYNIEKDTLEVYTRQQDISANLPSTAVN